MAAQAKASRFELGAAPASRVSALAACSAFLVSAAALGFEVALTSIFAVVLQYHAVHLAVAAGVSGLGAGALLAGRLAQRRPQVLSLVPGAAALAALAMVLVTWAAFQVDPGTAQATVPALAFLPFMLLGAALGLALRAVPDRAPAVYAADLSGGALGAAGVLILLNRFGGPQAALVLAVLPALAALAVALGLKEKPLRTGLAALAALVVLVAPIANGARGLIDFRYDRVSDPSGDKTMLRMLREENGKVVASQWNAFGRTDLVETPDPARKFLFLNGGAGAPMYRFDGDLTKVADLKEYMEYMPFAVTKPKKVLVIGAGGGIDVLMALLAGAEQVTALEINPGAVDLVRQYKEFNGGIFERPGVTLVEGDGRNFVSRDSNQYDLILLNLVFTQAAEARSFALSENYIFTQEAFGQYLKRLTPTGAVAVITHNPLEATRAYFTGLTALEAQGTKGAEAVRRTGLWFWPDGPIEEKQSLVLLRGSQYTKDEAAALKEAGTKFGLKDMFVPYVNEFMMAPLILGKTTVDKLVAEGDYNFFPTSDNRPFFYNLAKETPTAVTGFLTLAIIALFVLTLLSTLWASRTPGKEGRFWSLWCYFVLIGTGYMLIQVPVINRSVLLLGSPTLATALVIVAMLLGGAAGSAVSARLVTPRRSAVLGWVVAGAALVYLGVLPLLCQVLLPLSLGLRATLFGLSLLPVSFLMGMPFPTGLRATAVQGQQADIPLFYGLNGAASVLGSALAMGLAISGGYMAVMLLGVALYALLPLVSRRLPLIPA
jgi:MFS family permease